MPTLTLPPSCRAHLPPPAQAGQLSLDMVPDYSAVLAGGEANDITVAAVIAAASAAAAAAAAAVVAAAGKEVEHRLQACLAAGAWVLT